MQAEGWAVIDCTRIDVSTVSPTRRAAIVNWLVTRAGRFISTSTTDEQIEAYWADREGVDVIPVTVTESVA